jgi:hypothetical protein
MLLTGSFAAESRASADGTPEATVEPERIRPDALLDVPVGVVLRPLDDEGRRATFRPDQEYKCFTAPEWAQMGHLVTDYRWLWYYAIKLETRAALLEEEVGNYELQLGVLRDDVETTRRGFDSMTGLLEKEHDYRLGMESMQRFEVWAWRIGTVIGLVAAGAFGAAYGVERSR